MRNLLIPLLIFTPVVFAQTLNWPKDGYLEDWGFSRPSGCQPGNKYVAPLGRKFEQIYGYPEKQVFADSETSHNYYVSPNIKRDIINRLRREGGVGQETQNFRNYLISLKRNRDEIDETAAKFFQLSSEKKDIQKLISDIRSFKRVHTSCTPRGRISNNSGDGPAGTIACALAAQLIELTINLEDAVQLACHAGLPTPSATGSGMVTNGSTPPNSWNDSLPLDAPERLQAAQANQQQADRAFAGKRRAHDDNANTEQPTPGPRENTVTNRGPVRVNVAYCLDSFQRAYSGSLKCSAQRFGYTSVEVGQTVEVLPPKSGLQALTFSCKHPAKPYDVEFANDGLSGRCAAY